jgi:hypothetical protein
MSIYYAHLPNAFPYLLQVEERDIDTWTTFLNNTSPRSSYAVTSDNYQEDGQFVNLWLSKVSADRIAATGLDIPDYPR